MGWHVLTLRFAFIRLKTKSCVSQNYSAAKRTSAVHERDRQRNVGTYTQSIHMLLMSYHCMLYFVVSIFFPEFSEVYFCCVCFSACPIFLANGIPLWKDCYLRAPLESQTTNANKQITISWLHSSLKKNTGNSGLAGWFRWTTWYRWKKNVSRNFRRNTYLDLSLYINIYHKEYTLYIYICI